VIIIVLLLEWIKVISKIIIIIIIVVKKYNNGKNSNNSIKTRENVKRNNVVSLLSQTSTEWQVDKLTKEVTSPALQLDESLTDVKRNNN